MHWQCTNFVYKDCICTGSVLTLSDTRSYCICTGSVLTLCDTRAIAYALAVY